jgi:MFS family permease
MEGVLFTMEERSKGQNPKWYKLTESKNSMTWIAMVFIVFVATMCTSMENNWFNTYVYDSITPNPEPVAWMVSASAVTAALSAMIFGALSDRHRGRWGRRKPFILIGFVVAGIFTIVFAFADQIEAVKAAVPFVVVIDAFMMIGFGAAYDGTFGGYITDITNVNNRGRVQSIIQIITGLGGVVTSAIAGFTVDNFGYSVFFIAIGVLMIVAGILGGITLQEKPMPEKQSEGKRKSLLSELLGNFSIKSIKENKDLFLLLLAVTLWGSGWYAVVMYMLIYQMHYLGFSATEAGLASAISSVIGLFLAMPIGALSDKWGRKKITVISLILMIASAFGYSFIKPGIGFVGFIISQVILMLPLSGFGVCGNAWAKDLFPKGKTAQFAGISLIFIVTLPMIIGTNLGSYVIKTFGSPIIIEGESGFAPTPHLYYLAAIATILCIIPILFIKEKRVGMEETIEQIEEPQEND